MFVRVRMPIGQPHQALLVIDRAIGSDQGLKFVYVLDAENKVQYRRVSVGALQADGLRVIAQGLKADDRVLVGGLQQVRAHMQIQSEPKAMPPRRQETGVSKEWTADSCLLTPESLELAMLSRFFIDRPIFATVAAHWLVG